MKKILTIVIVVAVIAGGIYAYTQFNQRQAAAATSSSIQSEKASNGTLTAIVGATGSVRPNQTATLIWQTSGTVGEVEVEEGDLVKDGQLLASLDPEAFAPTIASAQLELINAQQALDALYDNNEVDQANALKEVALAYEALRSAEYNAYNFSVPSNQEDLEIIEGADAMRLILAEARNAYEPYKGSSSEYTYVDCDNINAIKQFPNLCGSTNKYDVEDQLEDAESDFKTAVDRIINSSEVILAEQNLGKALEKFDTLLNGPDPDDVAAAEARVEAAKATLNLTTIEGPFDGTITDVAAKSGDQVSAGTVAFRIDDLSRLLVDVEVSEVDINQVEVGQEVDLTFDGIFGKEYRGEVVEVALVGTDSQGVVNFIVTVELVETDEDVLSGMTAAVNIVVNQLEDVLIVPNRAVRVVEGDRVVYVLRPDGQVDTVVVILDASSDSHSEVVGGDLKIGDAIVLKPAAVQDIFQMGGGPPPGMGGGP
ncbi:MAG: efflux RND transporter periplasmic adaptor subunit [Anaerolineales bacterium]|nr:efflux RND transporter periplasmic adaptor subunit [Anaerolineales bacterium]